MMTGFSAGTASRASSVVSVREKICSLVRSTREDAKAVM